MLDLNIDFAVRFIYHSHCSSRNHTHDNYEIMVYLSGEGVLMVNGVNYPYRPNTIALIPPHTPHKKQLNSQEGEMFSFRFSCENMDYPISSLFFAPQNAEEIIHIARCLYDEIRARRPFHEKKARLHLENLLILLAREDMKASVPKHSSLEKIYDYICQNCTKKINLSALAAEANMSPDYFRHAFYKAFGLSPQSLLMEQRFFHAKQLLENQAMPITEVALHCGFSDASQFSHMFRKRYGMTPKQYRKMHIEHPLEGKEIKTDFPFH